MYYILVSDFKLDTHTQINFHYYRIDKKKLSKCLNLSNHFTKGGTEMSLV